MNRDAAIARLSDETFDVLVIGGGATGLGCAVDAASRGYKTALVEAKDFAHATSSRSSKLIHGGVRYLRQGNLSLVREALAERALLRRNAPDIVRELPFFIPVHGKLARTYYAAGLKLYDLLAGSTGFPKSRLTAGGALYWDAQFDDARLAIVLALTAWHHGAAIANYVRVRAFRFAGERAHGVEAVDEESGRSLLVSARAIINAAGIFSDTIRALEEPNAPPQLTFSRGSHVCADLSVLPDPSRAILVPQTSDKRVLFLIPWHDVALIGTTDVAVPEAQDEPRASDAEIAYLIATANPYLQRPITIGDLHSVFAGIRPLVASRAAATAQVSREHVVSVSRGGVVTVTGGKWTTYRRMAEDAVNAAARSRSLPPAACRTKTLALELTAAAVPSDTAKYAAEYEMARTVEDVLARRSGILFRDARAARDSAEAVAASLAQALGRPKAWADSQRAAFTELAARYIPGEGAKAAS